MNNDRPSTYNFIAVGLAFALIGFSPAYAVHCNCSAGRHVKYHGWKYTDHYYSGHQSLRVPSYRVPCSDEGQGLWRDAPLIPVMDYKAERFLYCVVISPIPGESQPKYDDRAINATQYYINLERSQRLKDMRKECDEAMQLEPTLPLEEVVVREQYTGVIASCHSAGFFK
jgi:hypothetical protein